MVWGGRALLSHQTLGWTANLVMAKQGPGGLDPSKAVAIMSHPPHRTSDLATDLFPKSQQARLPTFLCRPRNVFSSFFAFKFLGLGSMQFLMVTPIYKQPHL
jgi:hypothetical protein